MNNSEESGGERKRRRSEAFFGRRKGPQLNNRKSQLLANLLPSLIVDIDTSAPENLATLFSNSPSRIHLEIGFGGGEHLASQAILHSDYGHIGVEPFINGMAKMLGEIENSKLDNVRLFNEDATLLLDWLPDHSLDRIDLLYPDPWPKKRHWKRRFVNEDNLHRFARVLKSGGSFRFASDIDTYVNWTLVQCQNASEFSWTATAADSWHLPWSDWLRTRYEKKAIREDRTPSYLTFIRR